MAEINFTGVTYDYNNVTISIAEDVVGASKISISGVKIGSAADFDRIKNQLPTVVKIKNGVTGDLHTSTAFYYSTSTDTIRKAGEQSNIIISQDKDKNATIYKSQSQS